MRVSSADNRQSVDLQREAFAGHKVLRQQTYTEAASEWLAARQPTAVGCPPCRGSDLVDVVTGSMVLLVEIVPDLPCIHVPMDESLAKVVTVLQLVDLFARGQVLMHSGSTGRGTPLLSAGRRGHRASLQSYCSWLALVAVRQLASEPG
jgi:hypothetical protein